MKPLEKFSLGIGDRFARQGEAQLQAFLHARAAGIRVSPVWNKSNREHTLIGTEPASVRAEADAAVAALAWDAPHYVDADHINLGNVDRFISASDFFTLDVADAIGQSAPDADVAAFIKAMTPYADGIPLASGGTLAVPAGAAEAAARKFLFAAQEAGRIYRHVLAAKGADFVTEVSMDETDRPQGPVELFFILAMLAREGVPAQTIAPKFTGSFHKGVDYVGDLAQFEREFSEDLAVLAAAVREFGLPATLKLSVHSGSDKFSLYPIINRLLRERGCGLHVKTAGTTWLEEVIGLAEAGGDGLAVAKEIYAQALGRYDELAAPYAAVIHIHREQLPPADAVNAWTSDQFVAALRHDQRCPDYQPEFRQLVHISFKLAAEMGPRFQEALTAHREIVARNVTTNLWERHLRPIFAGCA